MDIILKRIVVLCFLFILEANAKDAPTSLSDLGPPEPLPNLCPNGDGNGNSVPYYEDPFDCNCYYVCEQWRRPMRMCCHSNLWWHPIEQTCDYMQLFPVFWQQKCYKRKQESLMALAHSEYSFDPEYVQNKLKRHQEEMDKMKKMLGPRILDDEDSTKRKNVSKTQPTQPPATQHPVTQLNIKPTSAAPVSDPEPKATSSILNGLSGFRAAGFSQPPVESIQVVDFSTQKPIENVVHEQEAVAEHDNVINKNVRPFAKMGHKGNYKSNNDNEVDKFGMYDDTVYGVTDKMEVIPSQNPHQITIHVQFPDEEFDLSKQKHPNDNIEPQQPADTTVFQTHAVNQPLPPWMSNSKLLTQSRNNGAKQLKVHEARVTNEIRTKPKPFSMRRDIPLFVIKKELPPLKNHNNIDYSNNDIRGSQDAFYKPGINSGITNEISKTQDFVHKPYQQKIYQVYNNQNMNKQPQGQQQQTKQQFQQYKQQNNYQQQQQQTESPNSRQGQPLAAQNERQHILSNQIPRRHMYQHQGNQQQNFQQHQRNQQKPQDSENRRAFQVVSDQMKNTKQHSVNQQVPKEQFIQYRNFPHQQKRTQQVPSAQPATVQRSPHEQQVQTNIEQIATQQYVPQQQVPHQKQSGIQHQQHVPHQQYNQQEQQQQQQFNTNKQAQPQFREQHPPEVPHFNHYLNQKPNEKQKTPQHFNEQKQQHFQQFPNNLGPVQEQQNVVPRQEKQHQQQQQRPIFPIRQLQQEQINDQQKQLQQQQQSMYNYKLLQQQQQQTNQINNEQPQQQQQPQRPQQPEHHMMQQQQLHQRQQQNKEPQQQQVYHHQQQHQSDKIKTQQQQQQHHERPHQQLQQHHSPKQQPHELPQQQQPHERQLQKQLQELPQQPQHAFNYIKPSTPIQHQTTSKVDPRPSPSTHIVHTVPASALPFAQKPVEFTPDNKANLGPESSQIPHHLDSPARSLSSGNIHEKMSKQNPDIPATSFRSGEYGMLPERSENTIPFQWPMQVSMKDVKSLEKSYANYYAKQISGNKRIPNAGEAGEDIVGAEQDEIKIENPDPTATDEDKEALSLDRYYANLPDEYIYGHCSIQPNPANTKLNDFIWGSIDLRQSLKGGPTEIRINMTGFNRDDKNIKHGFHVHEFGDLSEGCQTAGGHYDPFGVVHGSPDDDAMFRHFGDLGNVEEDKKGEVKHIISDYLVSLLGPFSVLGRAVVVHEKEDDLGRGQDQGSVVNGNAGQRLGCCTIGLSNGDRWADKTWLAQWDDVIARLTKDQEKKEGSDVDNKV